MNEPQQKFINKLLNIESQNQEFKLKYEREVKAMLDKRFNTLTRIVFALLALSGFVLTAVYLLHLFMLYYGWSYIAFIFRLSMLPAVVLFFLLSVLTGFLAVGGKMNITLKNNAQYLAIAFGIVLGFAVITQFMFTFVIPLTRENPLDWRSFLGTQMVFTLFFLLITLTLCVILKKIYHSELKTREKLLEIEYRIADLAEKLGEMKSDK